MSASALVSLLIYYICAGLYCGVLFAQAQGLPFTKSASTRARRKAYLVMLDYVATWPWQLFKKVRELHS